MENKTEDNKKESIRNVNEKWIDRIYESLVTVEMYERQFMNGAADIQTYINALVARNPGGVLSSSQISLIGYTYNEFSILFSNIEAIVPEEDMKILREKLKKCQDIANGRFGKLYSYRRGMNGGVTGLKIYNPYILLGEKYSEIRNDVVKCLSHILYAQDKTKSIRGRTT